MADDTPMCEAITQHGTWGTSWAAGVPDGMLAADQYVPSRAELDNEAYLVSRGVRPLALVGHCPSDPLVMCRVKTLLGRVRQAELVLPFIFTEGDRPEQAAFGYAAHRWIIGHLEWALGAGIPAARRHELLGMLCGYSPAAIARHQEHEGLWTYQPPEEEDGRG